MMTVRKNIEVHRHIPFKLKREDVVKRMGLIGHDVLNWKEHVPEYLEKFNEPFNPKLVLANFKKEIAETPLENLKATNPNLSSLNHCDHAKLTADWDVKEKDASRIRREKPEAEMGYNT